MKKLNNKTLDANVEFLESTRRLYRGATDIAKKLDEKKNSATSVLDIFTIENEVLRGKLKDYCERLLFKDPIGHAKKIEEILWRRGFYDAVSTAKKIVKTNEWSKIEKSLLLTHLSVGVGFYHHLILRLHLENKLDLAGYIDFAYPQNDCYNVQHQEQHQHQEQEQQLKKCLMKIVHRSLVCLGDLARYKLEFDANWDPMIAMRYYKMAITIEPNYGMPHNQLGTLAANKNYGIDAVYYYLRSTLCSLPFEGAEGNLNRIINTNNDNNNNNNKLPLAPSKICANLLFNLIKKWYNNNTPTTNKNDTCQMLLDNIENLLKTNKLNNNNDDDDNNNNPTEQATNIDKFLNKSKTQDLPYLSDNVVFKIVSICLMLISKLKKNNSSQLNQVIAFMLSVLSKLIQVTTTRLEMSIDKLSSSSSTTTTSDESIINHINDNENLIIAKTKNKNDNNEKNRVKSKSVLSKLRRPKKRVNSLDSDSSDIDEFDDNDDTSSDEYNSDKYVDSDESEQETDESSQDDDSNDSNDSNDSTDNIKQDENIKNNFVVDNEILIILTNEGLLQSIKICLNWLQDNQDIIKLAFKGSQLLLKRITIFFNLINNNINKIMKNKNIFNDESMIFSNNQDELLNNYIKIIPLPEDIDLQGLNILNASHNNIDWKILKTLNINNQEESLLRCLKIINFANYLCTIDESGLKHNDTNGFFYIDDLTKPNDDDVCSTSKLKLKSTPTLIVDHHDDNNDDLIINNNSKGQLMRHMGELWLKAEVKALENRLKSKLMSAYLVPDHDALAEYTPLLKRLVYTKKFIIVIPSIVVSALDELKRTSGHAREATRWLEGQLKKGSRFLRAQRPQEQLPLAYIKGPRPKDKEAWVFFQIIECCHYLQKQTKIDNDSNEPPVVTLLTGITRNNVKSSLTFSPEGLAQNAGINLEHIESFHTKWKTSSKSHG